VSTPGDVSRVFKDVIERNCSNRSKEEDEILKILVSELDSVQKLKSPEMCSLGSVLALLSFKIAPILCVIGFFVGLIYLIVTESPCLVALGPAGDLIGSPPMDCSMCANLTEVPRLSNVDVSEFVFNYHWKNVPIIVTDATQNWSAMKVISYEYLKGLYSNNPDAVDYDAENGQFFKYSSDLNGLEDLFNLTDERSRMQGKRWYIGWSTNDPVIGKEINKHFSTPYFLSPQPSIENRIAWIFMGSPGPGAYMHLDNVQLSSWQAQVRGKKTWILAPVPECEHVCHKMNATMNTGDMIVVDTNRWVHGTYIHPEGMSITVGSEFE
jgi:hypothetical protein